MTRQITYPGWTNIQLDDWIKHALQEDLECADITSWTTILSIQNGEAVAVAKQELVVCGLPIAQRIFTLLDPSIGWNAFVEEGQSVGEGDELFRVSGEIHAILGAERLVLNVLQHLSGIATTSREFMNAVTGTEARVVDTRKTLPGLRFLQRYAVRVGGCFNHRYHLGAGILIKENHIRSAGSIEAAVNSAKCHAPHTLRIEVEVTDTDELEQALSAGADIIMLDNMTPEQIKTAVDTYKGQAIFEASGGIHIGNVRDYALAGVDVISVGALTHSVKAADISLLVDANA